MKIPRTLARITLAFSFVAIQAGCGGGASSGSSSNSPSVLPDASAVESLPAEILRQIPSASYAVGSQERLAYTFLNAERIRCGFGTLQQDVRLDASAKAHARWGVINQQMSHTESARDYPNGFTGTTLTDRARYQVYNSQHLGEEFSGFANMTAGSSTGIASMRLLLNAPYHMVGLTDAFRDVGFSSQRPSDVGKSSGFELLMTELGVAAADSYQDLPADALATYPCEGSTGVAYSLSNESPNPVVGRNLATDPLGSSIIFRVRRGQSLTIDSLSVEEATSGAPVKLRKHVGGASGEADFYVIFDVSTAYVSADAPMKPMTAYNVKVTGANNGHSFSKQFKFTTGDIYLPSF